jgi:hypothetical protein
MDTFIPSRQQQLPAADGNNDGEAFATLRRFARARADIERCELCGSALATEHQHLLDRRSRQIACSCDACAILFCGQENAKFLRIPRRLLKLGSFALDDLAWGALMLPINFAFFLRTPEGQTQVLYPSPAGAMRSELSMPDWHELFAADPALLSVEPEVEALLVNRIGDQAAYFIAPLDLCYRLVGLIRTRWRGLSGGAELWHEIAAFFTDLEQRATPVGEGSHA